MSKQCPSCGEVKPATEFGRNKTLRDGLSFYCLSCNRARSNQWYRERRRRQGKAVRDHSWIPEGFRWCPSCEQAVAHEDYARSTSTASGFGSNCKSCKRTADRHGYFYRRYGLTPEGIADLRARQGNRCAICADSDPGHIDHDHVGGRVRGLLCERCNLALGLLRDDPQLMRSAAAYVEIHRVRHPRAREETSSGAPDAASRPGTPPVGSQRRPGRTRSSRSTGADTSDRRRQGPVGKADG
ncbi:endonuclease domain-containing protein [Blastococcus sp. SYSU D00820]